jgi:hypothetical protein
MQLTQKYITLPVAQPAPSTAPFVKPVSYEFRVAELLDEEGKIEKVQLQMQIWEHDEYGSGTVKQYWSAVPRIKIDKTGTIIP